jgi:TusE/DsrC/DsvC family sulfur relay protein
MNTINQYMFDKEGYLVNPEDWNEKICKVLAEQEGIKLDDEILSVLRFMHDFWEENRVAPDVRHVVDFMMSQQNYDKKFAKAKLFRMFPYGYVKQACKIAGMQRPRAWSTG